MKKPLRTITLRPQDAAVIFRNDGRLQTFTPKSPSSAIEAVNAIAIVQYIFTDGGAFLEKIMEEMEQQTNSHKALD